MQTPVRVAHRTGHCITDNHESCDPLILNGEKVTPRMVWCGCDCHPDPEPQDLPVTEVANPKGPWLVVRDGVVVGDHKMKRDALIQTGAEAAVRLDTGKYEAVGDDNVTYIIQKKEH